LFEDQHEFVFGVREWTVGATAVVEVTGELDIVAAASVSVRLDELTAGSRPDVVLDLRGVTFMDCSGLSVLVRVRKRTLERGGRLGIVGDSPQVLRLLRLTRLSRSFALHDDLASALAAPGGTEQPDDAANGAIA
jgi:anti-anti-sigma factor